MRVGAFVLGAQFPGQRQEEALAGAVRAAEIAEESGLDDVWIAEHHFVPYGVCPSAVTLAGLLLGRTRRIGVGTAVSVLPNTHPVALGEQTALLHLTSGGRFTLGVGRGGPWVDLEVFGGGLPAYEEHFPEALDVLLRWLREPSVEGTGPRFRFREVPVVPRALGTRPARAAGTGTATGTAALTDADAPEDAGAPVVVACTSPKTVRTAARHALPMLLGMHCDDAEKAEMTALWRREALAAGNLPERVELAESAHVSAGVAQVGDSVEDATAALTAALPGWLRQGLGAHRTVDGRERPMRDPLGYTEHLCGLHAVGAPKHCADRLATTSERTGIRRFALLVEGAGDPARTETNVARLGTEVLPLLQ